MSLVEPCIRNDQIKTTTSAFRLHIAFGLSGFLCSSLAFAQTPKLGPSPLSCSTLFSERISDTTPALTLPKRAKLTVSDLTWHNRLTESEEMDWRHYLRLSTDKKKIQFIDEQLNANGVDHRIIYKKLNESIMKVPHIEILPSQHHPLNQLAQDLAKKYQIQLLYTPHLISWGGYDVVRNIVYLSSQSALFARPDTTLFHEIKHAANVYKAKIKREPPLINGMASLPFNGKESKWTEESWPWSAPEDYEHQMSFDETSTWKQDFRYEWLSTKKQILSALEDGQPHSLPVNPFKDFQTLSIIEHAQNLVRYELLTLTTRENSVSIQLAKDGRSLDFKIKDDSARIIQHEVPSSWFRRYLPLDLYQSLHERQTYISDHLKTRLTNFFSNPENEFYIHAIALSYLQTLGKRFEHYSSDLKSKLKLFLIARSAIESDNHLPRLFEDINGETNDFEIMNPASNPSVDRETISLIKSAVSNEANLARIENQFIEKFESDTRTELEKSQVFGTNKTPLSLSADSLSLLNYQSALSTISLLIDRCLSIGSFYGVLELHIIPSGRTSDPHPLQLEWSTNEEFKSIEMALQYLYASKVKILSATLLTPTIPSISMSPSKIQKGDVMENWLNLGRINGQEIVPKNMVRTLKALRNL